ncbi:MAG: hypothetical protein AABO41_00885 [Acidobacteriota bacterium]
MYLSTNVPAIFNRVVGIKYADRFSRFKKFVQRFSPFPKKEIDAREADYQQ